MKFVFRVAQSFKNGGHISKPHFPKQNSEITMPRDLALLLTRLFTRNTIRDHLRGYYVEIAGQYTSQKILGFACLLIASRSAITHYSMFLWHAALGFIFVLVKTVS